MKLQFLVDGESEDDYEYIDIYLDEQCIIGFFVPNDTTEYIEQLLNIVMLNGDRFTIIITKELTDFLDNKFNLN